MSDAIRLNLSWLAGVLTGTALGTGVMLAVLFAEVSTPQILRTLAQAVGGLAILWLMGENALLKRRLRGRR